MAHLWNINKFRMKYWVNAFHCSSSATTRTINGRLHIYMFPPGFVARDSSSRCNNLCVRRLRNTFPYRHTILQPNSNKSESTTCTGERDRRAMRMLHLAANNCLSKPSEPQWKQLSPPNSPSARETESERWSRVCFNDFPRALIKIICFVGISMEASHFSHCFSYRTRLFSPMQSQASDY